MVCHQHSIVQFWEEGELLNFSPQIDPIPSTTQVLVLQKKLSIAVLPKVVDHNQSPWEALVNTPLRGGERGKEATRFPGLCRCLW